MHASRAPQESWLPRNRVALKTTKPLKAIARARRIAFSSRKATAQAVRVVDALISNAGAAIKAMVLTTDDSLEDILAETVAPAFEMSASTTRTACAVAFRLE